MPARVRKRLLTPALLAGFFATLVAPSPTSAQAPSNPGMTSVPGADAFNILYYLTNEEGARAGFFSQQHFTQFLNQARCECGYEIQTQVRLKTTNGMTYDTTKLVETFVGTMCATAEMTPFGQFRRCAKLASKTVPDYVQGLTRNFHPIWLTAGVDSSVDPENRDPSTATAAGSCSGNPGGQSGIWMCAQTNTTQGCQSDEFFIQGLANNNLPNMTGLGIAFDFLPPVTKPTGITSAAGDSAIVVSWTLDGNPGDINGYRVLCEEADSGNPPPGKGMSAPAHNVIPDGTIYYTAKNLCGNKPWSTFLQGDVGPVDPTTTTGTTDDSTTTDATAGDTDTTSPFYPLFEATTGTGSDTGSDTDTTDASTGSTGGSSSTGVAMECGNLVVEGSEECDDGPNNGPDKECLSDAEVDAENVSLGCTLNKCGDGYKGPAEECDDGANNGAGNLCNADCTLNISAGLKELDWGYVCSGHLPFNTTSARIEGLENGKKYNFMLVYYDKFGNPAAFPALVSDTPVDTNDLWEQCYDLDQACGKSGFCNVSGDGDPLLGLGGLMGLGLGFVGLRRRRRARTTARSEQTSRQRIDA
ncbi:MAG: hypothetical protein JNL82_20380 [Myxococcales bacterium]|nr:hypothetical protein [Myxococcales bacterium]